MNQTKLSGQETTLQACHEFADHMAREIENHIKEYLAIMKNIKITGQQVVTGAKLSETKDPYRKLATNNVIKRMKSILPLVIANQRDEGNQLTEIIYQLGLRKLKQEIRKGDTPHVR